MKHHYIVEAIMGDQYDEYLCPLGATCERGELGETLMHLGAKSYRIKSVDWEPVADWENTDWISVTGIV